MLAPVYLAERMRAMREDPVITYRGGCNCGRNRFGVEGDLKQVMDCNRSIRTLRGYLHWGVPQDKFRLLTSQSRGAYAQARAGEA